MTPEGVRPVLSAPQQGTTIEPAKPRSRLALHIKELFGKLAEAVTSKPTPTLAAKRKRREETSRAFNLARRLTIKVTRSILHFLYRHRPYDPEQERAYAEHVLRTQMEEWTQDNEQQQGDQYVRAAGFDHHP